MSITGTPQAVLIDLCPVTLAEAKLHLRVDANDDDSLITALIEAATGWAEKFQGRLYIQRQVVEKLDRFPARYGVIVPQYMPLISVTAIEYIDTNGRTQTVDREDYSVDTNGSGRIVPAYNCSWPATQGHLNDVTITYQAGYGEAADVPAQVKAAIKMLVGNWYENREATLSGISIATVPLGVESLLWQDRMSVL